MQWYPEYSGIFNFFIILQVLFRFQVILDTIIIQVIFMIFHGINIHIKSYSWSFIQIIIKNNNIFKFVVNNKNFYFSNCPWRMNRIKSKNARFWNCLKKPLSHNLYTVKLEKNFTWLSCWASNKPFCKRRY